MHRRVKETLVQTLDYPTGYHPPLTSFDGHYWHQNGKKGVDEHGDGEEPLGTEFFDECTSTDLGDDVAPEEG